MGSPAVPNPSLEPTRYGSATELFRTRLLLAVALDAGTKRWQTLILT